MLVVQGNSIGDSSTVGLRSYLPVESRFTSTGVFRGGTVVDKRKSFVGVVMTDYGCFWPRTPIDQGQVKL
ncbi:hypothetical protein QP027_11885 [Corynebacterium breve]|uniref:Uncharacterized protein n=1 Tax=Corynebacterium breve TaxID=3049799 RepID=A0ABY8VF65_9CORY|nr:hypothetical protein [Corynebacterium breve]WIM67757.1 hypothetical protein QP027_11885 [Corynebacterium breve]